MSRLSKVAAVSILAPNTGSPTKRAAPRSERHISASRWMQRTTKPSGVPESPASSEKGCGGRAEWRLNVSGLGELPQPPANPGTYHTPGPLVDNLHQPKIQLSHKLLHRLVQATGHLNLTNPLGHSFDSFHPLQRRKAGSDLQLQDQGGHTLGGTYHGTEKSGGVGVVVHNLGEG